MALYKSGEGLIYKIYYDNLTIDLRRTSNLQNILRRTQYNAGQEAVMRCGREVNRRSVIALAMRHHENATTTSRASFGPN